MLKCVKDVNLSRSYVTQHDPGDITLEYGK